MPALKAGGPYTLDIRASNHLVVKDILIGDVWFCSGQSNMVIPMERVKEKYPDDIVTANFPQIRNFFVPTAADVVAVHTDLLHSGWKEADPTNVLAFGAATYFFARDLYRKYHVPIGIVNSSVGGMPIQAWISAAGLDSLSGYAERIAKFHDPRFMRGLGNPDLGDVPPFRGNLFNRRETSDLGLTGTVKWYQPEYVPAGWHPFWLPGYWADQGVKGLNGVVWFRKEIEVPASMAGKPAKLFVGRIVDADETYLNGVKVGNITYQYPPRSLNSAGPPPFSALNEPTGLYNTMVAPAIRFAIKGFLWYQGESNTGNAREYKLLMPALIADCRAKWHEGNLPFLYVQLPNYMEVQYSPSESQWAELREAQLDALSVPNTAMAVAIDAGEWNDLHPLDKKDIGERLALAAEKLAYGDSSIVAWGPIFQAARVDGDKIILSFTGIGSGLMVKGGGELQQFAIAGADQKFVWADARIDGDQVIVSSPDVSQPLYVRYAWADNPEGANLYNKEGLPASPFRTDQEK